MTVEIEGLAALAREFGRMIRDIGPAAERGLQDVALDLKGKSVALAPLDTGDLRGSGYANPQPDGSWDVGFSEVYAVVQHERLDFNHPKGGQAKYLEQPFRENLERYARHVADAARKTWGG